MSNFKPKFAQPGEPIRAEDWNRIQQGILDDLSQLEAKYVELRDYVDHMSEVNTVTNLESPQGRSYRLDQTVPSERGTYETAVVGYITKQWVPPIRGATDICRFTVTSVVDQVDYWAGAENGNRKALDVTLRYVDGTTDTQRNLFVHDRRTLSPRGDDNPYLEYMLTPNQWVWYRYRLVNPNPDKEVLSILFGNSDDACTPRIANVLQLRTKVKQLM